MREVLLLVLLLVMTKEEELNHLLHPRMMVLMLLIWTFSQQLKSLAPSIVKQIFFVSLLFLLLTNGR
jgi:hypothetical protein